MYLRVANYAKILQKLSGSNFLPTQEISDKKVLARHRFEA